jgi:hypothetical protein
MMSERLTPLMASLARRWYDAVSVNSLCTGRLELLSSDLPYREDVAQRLPLPLAQLYRRAHNAKSPLECCTS